MDSLDKYFYDNGAETKNLTWTEITESNFASACNNPAKQNFAITIGGDCVGFDRTYRYSSKGDIYTDYAYSCKITALTCGSGQALFCQLAYWPNQCHCYKSGDSHYLVRGTAGQRIVKTIYSAQALPGLPFCNYDGTIKYYSHYSGASSGCMTCAGGDCGDSFMRAARSSNKTYIVRKKK